MDEECLHKKANWGRRSNSVIASVGQCQLSIFPLPFIVHKSKSSLNFSGTSTGYRSLAVWWWLRFASGISLTSNLQNFMSINRGVFVRRLPEMRMFPQESKIVHKHNTELSAAILTREKHLKLFFVMVGTAPAPSCHQLKSIFHRFPRIISKLVDGALTWKFYWILF